jgi:hypothetical protein
MVQAMVWKWRSLLGRLDVREVLARSYSTSSYFSNPVNEFPFTYDIERIDEGFSVGNLKRKL